MVITHALPIDYCYRTSPDGGESDAISVIRDLQFGGQEPSLQCVGIRTCGDSKYENTEEIYVDIYVTLHAQPVELTITTATVFITNDDCKFDLTDLLKNLTGI